MALFNSSLKLLNKTKLIPNLTHVIATRSLQQFSLNFSAPKKSLFNNEQVERVKFTTEKGPVEIKAGQDAFAQRILGGLVEVEQNKEIKKFIVSGGFAIINPDKSMSISAAEAYPLDYIDLSATKQNLIEAERQLPENSDEDRVRIKIAMEMYQAIIDAFEK